MINLLDRYFLATIVLNHIAILYPSFVLYAVLYINKVKLLGLTYTKIPST